MREDAREAERIKADLSALRQEIEQAEQEEEDTRRQNQQLRLLSHSSNIHGDNSGVLLKSEPNQAVGDGFELGSVTSPLLMDRQELA